MKKGMFKDDKKLWEMYNKIKMNTFERQNVVISLLDEANGVAMSWDLKNSFPVKMSIADLKADANEAAVETLELAHEGFNLTGAS
jgi:phage tail-like protein